MQKQEVSQQISTSVSGVNTKDLKPLQRKMEYYLPPRSSGPLADQLQSLQRRIKAVGAPPLPGADFTRQSNQTHEE